MASFFTDMTNYLHIHEHLVTNIRKFEDLQNKNQIV